jgi:hypothetical protein
MRIKLAKEESIAAKHEHNIASAENGVKHLRLNSTDNLQEQLSNSCQLLVVSRKCLGKRLTSILERVTYQSCSMSGSLNS